MNYTTALVFAISLLAQIVSCSEGNYKIVCKTEYSYVLKNFNRNARLFQEKLEEVYLCFRPSVEYLATCLSNIEIPPSYYHELLNLDVLDNKLTAENVNNLHESVCSRLNEYAGEKMYAKDIALTEYNVLTQADVIGELLNSISIGIKVKTCQSEELKYIGKFTNLISEHFDTIKACLSENSLIDKFLFCKCVSKKIIPEGDNLASLIEQLPEVVEFMGGLSVVDDIDLKIELNKYLNRMTTYSYDEDYPTDLILREYSSNLSNEQIDGLKKKCVRWFWIKIGVAVFGVAAVVGLVGYFFKKKTATVDEEEKVNYEA